MKADLRFCGIVMVAVIGWVLLPTRSASAGYNARDLYTLTYPGTHYFNLVYISNVVAANGQVVVATGSGGNPDHAVVWDAHGNPIDLNPPGFSESEDFATNGTQQVGFARDSANGGLAHAFLWNGTAASGVDLNPTNVIGIGYSVAEGTNGSQQVGLGAPDNTVSGHAFLWSGTADSAVDLNPAGLRDSEAIGTDGIHQVGLAAGPTTAGRNHAFRWTGTAASAVDLHPSGYLFSGAQAVSGNQVVGVAYLNDTQGHAMLWTGTAASAVDLNPGGLGITFSVALGTNGTEQVGGGTSGMNSPTHALLWSSTAASAIDLQALLPSDFIGSEAYSIDAAGNVYGLATDAAGDYHAIEWAVPEPAAFAPLALTVLVLSPRRWGVRVTHSRSVMR